MPELFHKLKTPRNKILIACLTALVWLVLAAQQEGFIHLPGHSGTGHPVIDGIIRAGKSSNEDLTLVTEPDEGTKTVIGMIDSAKESVDLVMYSLNDKDVEAALVRAKDRGLAVRVLLNGGYKGQEPPSKKSTITFDRLIAQGMSVRWSQAYFDLTHQKTLVVDGSDALIMTGNLDKTYYKKDRDFQVEDSDPADVNAIEAAFVSDWNGSGIPASDGSDLIWSPGSEGELVALIGSAKNSLLIYNEEMDDVAIENALEEAARRGVNVQVVMSMDTGWLTAFSALDAAGVHIRTFDSKAPVYVHAKMILADGKLAFLGSENFSDGSLDDNRELGLLFSKPDMLSKLEAVFDSDWQQAQPFSS